LDMLRLDKPVEMSVDDEGNCVDSGRGKGFNLNEVKGELIEVAKKIQHDYEHSFKPTDKDDNCKFCGYKFYCEKWGE